MLSEPVVVITHCPDETVASRIATHLVTHGLAACVSQLAAAQSTYRWNGAVERATEVPLLIKTTRRRYPDVEAAIRTLHPYDVPEIVALPVLAGFAPYLDWIDESTRDGGTALA